MNTEQQQIRNRDKYIVAPTWPEIEEYLRDNRMCMADFERVYNMTKLDLKKVKNGKRELPSRLWHIIYEKISLKDFLNRDRAENRAENVTEYRATNTPVDSLQPDTDTKKEQPIPSISSALKDRLKRSK